MSELDNRKKLLMAEAEVYRQTLKLEIQNLRIYAIKTKRKLTSFNAGNPALMLGIPMLTTLLSRRRGKMRRWGAWGFMGWQLFQRVSEMLRSRSGRDERYEAQAAAEEYLEKRI